MLFRMRKIFKDARHFQIIYLATFLLLGILFLNGNEEVSKYVLLIFGAMLFQYIGTSLSTSKKG
jgi:hypothetical protein